MFVFDLQEADKQIEFEFLESREFIVLRVSINVNFLFYAYVVSAIHSFVQKNMTFGASFHTFVNLRMKLFPPFSYHRSDMLRSHGHNCCQVCRDGDCDAAETSRSDGGLVLGLIEPHCGDQCTEPAAALRPSIKRSQAL